MSVNLYWSIYQNLEDELMNLSHLIHINDHQLNVYSVKIAELIIRAAVEVESLAKELYYKNSVNKPNTNDLYFDTGCMALLEDKWLLSKKIVQVTGTNFYFENDGNINLRPLNKANQRGCSAPDWLRAYQAIKHNRSENLEKATLKHLIKALAGLFLLNVYYKEHVYTFDNLTFVENFNNGLGSKFFSIKVHKTNDLNLFNKFKKNDDFNECVYIIKPNTDSTRQLNEIVDGLNQQVENNTDERILKELNQAVSRLKLNGKEDIENWLRVNAPRIQKESFDNSQKKMIPQFKNWHAQLKYEAILNQNQF